MSNTALWDAVCTTPPDQTKAITGKPYNGTSPKPHYLVRKATETFGPCGIGWGFSIVEEKVLDGAMLEPGFYERLHMARVRVWYEWNNKRGEVEHVGQTVFSGKRNNGKPFTDEDAPKKSVTDALVKALSMIGFAGDIFMGRYDDSKYVSELREVEKAKAPQRPQAKPPAPKDAPGQPTLENRYKTLSRALETAKDVDQLASIWARAGYISPEDPPAGLLAELHEKRPDLYNAISQARDIIKNRLDNPFSQDEAA